jgi:hypothetical protein
MAFQTFCVATNPDHRQARGLDPVASAKLSVMMELKVRKLDATASSGFSLLQQDFQRYPGVSLARFFLTAHTSCIIQVIYEPGSKHSHNNGGLLSHT